MTITARLTTLQQSGASLIRNTKSAKQQKDYSDEVKSDIIGGMRLGTTVSVEDAEDYAREVVVNSAKKVGRTSIKSADVDKILNSSLKDLDINYQQIGQLSADAFSIGGIQAMSSGNITADSAGLLSTTSNMLSDGKLTGAEIASVSLSAAKTAGSVVAMYSGTLAMGPLGAIAAIPMTAVNYLQAEIDEQEALDRAAHEYAKKVIAEERAAVDKMLSDARTEYTHRRDLLWQDADRVVSDLAELWNKSESDLGVAFDLRFFPGEAPPPKGGLWDYPQIDGQPCTRAETPAGGQVYFPRGDVGGYIKAPCSTDPYKEYSLNQPTYSFPGYLFYRKTIRALNSLLPREEKAGFWVPVGHSQRDSLVEWKDYEQLVYALYVGLAKEANQTPPATEQRALERHENMIAYSAKDHSYKAPSVASYALDYVTALFDGLIEEGEHVNVFKLRIFADIIQTSSAVRSEISVAKHLREAGLLDVRTSQLTQADKRGIALSVPKPAVLGKAVLWAGVAVASFGGYRYWQRHHGR